ncbi:MAG: helix-turn-helix domain-containing protein [Oscillospiraceae bacterium]|nr:helix-turn-helix domain-containing protein [Oscillospiraceae bacterium]
MNCLGDRLRIIRLENGLTQEKLGELCDTSGAVIRSIEKSRRMPSYEMLALLCNTLKTSPEYLMQDDLTFSLSNDDKKEIIAIIDRFSPSQLYMLKDILLTSKKHIADNNVLK